MQLRKYLAAFSAALMLTGASVAQAALTPIDVTWNPSGAGISTQGPFTFDDVVLATYASIDLNAAGTSFTEQGFLRLSTFTNDGLPTSIPTSGFPSGTPYSLYISFTATGTQTAGVPSTGTFNTLSYTLFGAPGVTVFNPNGSGQFSASGAAPVTLASGTLLTPGATSITVDPVTGLLLPAAQLSASFLPNQAVAGFFVNPPATATLDVTAAFTNTGTVVTVFPLNDGGRRLSLNGGGGNATFALAPVPEPDTYGMLAAGLGLLGFIARRKSRRDNA